MNYPSETDNPSRGIIRLYYKFGYCHCCGAQISKEVEVVFLALKGSVHSRIAF